MQNFIEILRNILSGQGINYEDGLTEEELVAAEQYYGFIFPPDLRDILKEILIKDGSFINWKQIGSEKIKGAMDWPFDGFCFDIKNNVLWDDKWGEKPSTPLHLS